MDAGDHEEFHESGRLFRFPAACVFKPDAVTEKGLQGVKGCDFVWRKSHRKVWVIEVKTSAPRPGDQIHEYLDEIVTKFLHSTLLWLAAMGGRHQGRIVLPKRLSAPDGLKAKPQLVLVVMNLDPVNASDLQDALQGQVHTACRAFDMDPPQIVTGAALERKLPVVPTDAD